MRFSRRWIVSVAALAAGLMVGLTTSAQSIFTHAGGGSVDGRPASTIPLDGPVGIAVDSAGNVYITESARHQVRKVTVASGVIHTIAGSGSPGDAGDGGAATSGSLNEPSDVAVDAAGNVFIADSRNHRIRRITPNGIISRYAGTSSFGLGGDGGAADERRDRSVRQSFRDRERFARPARLTCGHHHHRRRNDDLRIRRRQWTRNGRNAESCAGDCDRSRRQSVHR